MIVMKCILLFALAIVCPVELRIPPRIPVEVGIAAYQRLTLAGSIDCPYVAVAHDKVVVSRRGSLSLQFTNGTQISEANLGYQPDEVYSYNRGSEGIHIVAVAHSERSTRNRVTHCTYYSTRDPGLRCRGSFSPPTKFVVSVLINDWSIHVWAIYYDSNEQIYKVHDVRNGDHDSLYGVPLRFPDNCTCTNSDCLRPINEPNGKVLIQCDNGDLFLYDVLSEYSYISPPNVKEVTTSKYGNFLFAVQPAAGPYQESLIQARMVTDSQDAAARPFPGVHVNSPLIRDLAIVVVNKTSQLEVGFYIRNNTIFYFEVVDLGILPVIEYVPLSPELMPIAFRGSNESSIFFECVHNNGSLVLITIKAQLKSDFANDTVGSDGPPISATPPTFCPPDHCNTESPQGRTNQSDHGSHPIDEPKPTDVNNEPVNSSRDSSDNSSLNSGQIIMYVGCGLLAGVIITSPCVVVLFIMVCRREKSRRCDIAKREEEQRDVELCKQNKTDG